MFSTVSSCLTGRSAAGKPAPQDPSIGARDNAAQKNALTKTEADCIRIYTHNGSRELNAYLRARASEIRADVEDRDLRNAVRITDSGLSKLSDRNQATQKTFRGASSLPEGLIQENTTFSDPAYLSASRCDTKSSKKIVEKFAGSGDVFVVLDKSGVDLPKNALTHYKHEREVLYPRGTEFNVLLHADIPAKTQKYRREKFLGFFEPQKPSAIGANARRITVLEERGTAPIDLATARKTRPDVDISPAVDPRRKSEAPHPNLETSRKTRAEVDISPALPPGHALPQVPARPLQA